MYDRNKAIEYASIWWNKRNPKFYNFDNLGGDCTNFVSQCLLAGGIEMNFNSNGWFYQNLSKRSPAWSGVDELYAFGISNKSNGVKFRKVTISEVSIGDIIQFRKNSNSFTHTLIITKISHPSPSGIFVACHSNDAFNKPLINYTFQEIRFLKVIN